MRTTTARTRSASAARPRAFQHRKSPAATPRATLLASEIAALGALRDEGPSYAFALSRRHGWGERTTGELLKRLASMGLGLGTSVLNLPYYNPVLLARRLTTLDVLSGGRFRLGLVPL